MHSLTVVYAGTPEFAVPALDALVCAGHRVVCVYSQPDRPAGRGRSVSASPVKVRALELGLRIEQPEDLKGIATQAQLREFAPDLMVVAAYGVLLPPEVLSIPKLGCINIHASLLPRWRGAAPIQRAILAGDERTGVAIMRMEAGLDTGPVYAEAECPIASDDTTFTLTSALARLGAKTLVSTIPAIANGSLHPVPQPPQGVLYARKVTKSEALLDWSRPAIELERAVRAYQPWPVAETRWRGAQLRIHAATAIPGEASADPGRIVAAGPSGFDVATGAGLLRLTRVQSAGRGVVDAAQFGQSESRKGALVGTVLGAAA